MTKATANIVKRCDDVPQKLRFSPNAGFAIRPSSPILMRWPCFTPARRRHLGTGLLLARCTQTIYRMPASSKKHYEGVAQVFYLWYSPWLSPTSSTSQDALRPVAPPPWELAPNQESPAQTNAFDCEVRNYITRPLPLSSPKRQAWASELDGCIQDGAPWPRSFTKIMSRMVSPRRVSTEIMRDPDCGWRVLAEPSSWNCARTVSIAALSTAPALGPSSSSGLSSWVRWQRTGHALAPSIRTGSEVHAQPEASDNTRAGAHEERHAKRASNHHPELVRTLVGQQPIAESAQGNQSDDDRVQEVGNQRIGPGRTNDD